MTTPSNAVVISSLDSGLSDQLCVLVVEDDEADAYLICRALTRQSAIGRVVRASNGAEALWMVEGGHITPDLAFIDLQMPVKGGLSLLIALAERPGPQYPKVILTSSSSPVDATRSRLRGAIRVISKPETVDALETELASAVDAACTHRSRQRFEGDMLEAQFRRIPSTPHAIALEDGLDL